LFNGSVLAIGRTTKMPLKLKCLEGVRKPIHGEIMQTIQRQIGLVAKLLAALLLGSLAAACTAPVPKPAMVPLGQTGDFGYSERDVGTDRIEVTYTGSTIRVSSSADSRLVAERAKTRDLAIWRAAQIADQRGMAAMKIENEERDTGLQVTWDYYGHGYGSYYPYGWRRYGYWGSPSWFYDDPYYYQPVRRAYGQSVTTLTLQLLNLYDPNDAAQLPVKETLTRLQSARSGAAY
jgi:hypothetical protein